MAPGENHTTADSGAGIEIVSMPAELDLTTSEGHRRGPLGIPVKAAGDAGLVMVLQETSGAGSVRPPQVRARTPLVISMAMSQRIPSHRPAMPVSTSAVAARRARENASS